MPRSDLGMSVGRVKKAERGYGRIKVSLYRLDWEQSELTI